MGNPLLLLVELCLAAVLHLQAFFHVTLIRHLLPAVFAEIGAAGQKQATDQDRRREVEQSFRHACLQSKSCARVMRASRCYASPTRTFGVTPNEFFQAPPTSGNFGYGGKVRECHVTIHSIALRTGFAETFLSF